MKSLGYTPGVYGGGSYYVFIFEPKESGKGDIVMQLPYSFDQRHTVERTFTIVAEECISEAAKTLAS